MVLYYTLWNLMIPFAFGQDLQGMNMRVVGTQEMGFVRNSSGSIIRGEGRIYNIFDWLAKFAGVGYTFVPASGLMTFETVGNHRGALSYLASGEADIALGAITMTNSRLATMDLTFPWSVSKFSLMIPVTDPSGNFKALWQPFDWIIWTCLAVAVVFVLFALVAVNRIFKNQLIGQFSDFSTAMEYVISVLLAQGSVCYSQKLAIRLLAGAWALAAFVIVYGYSSMLISFVTSPNNDPLIESIHDLPNKPNVHLVVEQGKAVDLLFSGAQRGILKYAGDDLNRNPHLRCSNRSVCVNMVLSGSYVFANPATLFKQIIADDLKNTGRCRLTIAKEDFIGLLSTFALKKGSPFSATLNKGMLQLWETGLLVKWHNEAAPNPRRCLNIRRNDRKTRLSIKNLTSAFILLVGGMFLATVAFLVENVCGRNYRFNCPASLRVMRRPFVM